MLSEGDEYTPTPVISHAILTYNRGRKDQFADGIVITPSHNPPSEGGFKYNPPNGGPAEPIITNWIQDKANEFLENKMSGIKRIPYEKALHSSTTKRHNYLKSYVYRPWQCDRYGSHTQIKYPHWSRSSWRRWSPLLETDR